MILEKLEKKDGFTETEKVIADYLLDFSHSIVGFTSSKLGEVTYTSQTSVVRLYKKLGFNNYMVFYSTLIQEITERKNMEEIDYIEPITSSMSVEEVISTISKYYAMEIQTIKLSVDKNKFQRLYNHLNNTNVLLIFGDGQSSYYMNLLSNKLSRMGINSFVIHSPHQIHSNINYSNKENTAIVFSFNEHDPFLKNMIIKIKEEPIFLFGIVNSQNNEHRFLCDEYVSINEMNDQDIEQVSILFIIDVIYSMFMTHNV